MESNIFTRCFETRFKLDGDSSSHLTGHPIVFNQRTDLGFFEEIIEPGALDNTDFRDVLFFVNHDTGKIPLARSRNNNANSTMHIRVEDGGMVVDITLDTENNTEARNLYSAISRGDISGMSFSFRVADDAWENLDSKKPLRRIKAISTVKEVSAVTFPAYPQTSITARNREALENARAELESARQHSLDSELELEKLKCTLLYGG